MASFCWSSQAWCACERLGAKWEVERLFLRSAPAPAREQRRSRLVEADDVRDVDARGEWSLLERCERERPRDHGDHGEVGGRGAAWKEQDADARPVHTPVVA